MMQQIFIVRRYPDESSKPNNKIRRNYGVKQKFMYIKEQRANFNVSTIDV